MASSLEQGPKYDAAASVLAEKVFAADPRGGAEWAAAIGEAGKRRETMGNVFEGLGRQLGLPALEVAADLGLSYEERKLVEDAVARGASKR